MHGARVRIAITPEVSGSRIFVEDQELKGVRAIHVHAVVGEASSVTIELVAAEVRIDGVMGEIFTGGLIL
jgi:hypothetical protein